VHPQIVPAKQLIVGGAKIEAEDRDYRDDRPDTNPISQFHTNALSHLEIKSRTSAH
jgi:hypothetical protein